MIFEFQKLLDVCGGHQVNVDSCRWSGPELDVGMWRDLKFTAWPVDVASVPVSQQAVVFFFSKKLWSEFMQARPRVIVTAEAFVETLMHLEVEPGSFLPWKDAAIVVSSDPYLAMARLSQAWSGQLERESSLADECVDCVHPTAVIDSTARLGNGVRVGAFCVIGPGAVVGDHSRIHERVSVGRGVVLGRHVELFPGVTIYKDCVVGNNVRIHCGSVIGSDGFGYAPARVDGKFVRHEKIEHLGRVLVGDSVEIGANTCIDRGTLGDTVVHAGAKIDNLVQIGHNVQIGKDAVICGTTGIAGSAEIGELAYIGGKVGIANGVHIGPGAMVAAMTAVGWDVEAGQKIAGNPQRPFTEHFRIHALLNRMLKDRRKS